LYTGFSPHRQRLCRGRRTVSIVGPRPRQKVGVETEEPRGEEPRFLGGAGELSKLGPEGDVEALRL
jgi:hypothetical protein